MIRTSAAALLLSTALMTGAVVAQTSTTATGTPAGQAAGSGSTQFLTEQDQNQFRASKFVGLAIYGTDNQRIGDINEILIDGSGSAKAIVIGVGGFLGIGEKNVAVPFSAVEWKNERPAGTAANTTGSAGGMNTAANTTAAGGSSSAGMGSVGSGTTATTGTTGGSGVGAGTVGTSAGMGSATTSGAGGTMGAGGARDTSAAGAGTATTAGAAARSPAETAAMNGYPDHGMIRMSKADLQNAPTFRYYGQAQSNATTGGTAGSGTSTTAPRQ